MVLGCFLGVFPMFFGSLLVFLLVAFWEPLGAGLLEFLGSCGKDLEFSCLLDFLYLSSQ